MACFIYAPCHVMEKCVQRGRLVVSTDQERWSILFWLNVVDQTCRLAQTAALCFTLPPFWQQFRV